MSYQTGFLPILLVLIILLPTPLFAQSTQPPTVTGQIILSLKDADGNLVVSKKQEELAFDVRVAKREGSEIIPKDKVSCRLGSQTLSQLTLNQPFCVSPGTYLLEAGYYNSNYYAGYPFSKQDLFFEVKERETVFREFKMTLLEISLSRFDKSLITDASFSIYEVKIDANGVASPGEVLNPRYYFTTGSSGVARIRLTPGRYYIKATSEPKYEDAVWFLGKVFNLVELSWGQKVSYRFPLGRIDIVPRNQDGSLQETRRAGVAVVYVPKIDANGMPQLPTSGRAGFNEGPSKIFERTGVASFDILPGTYSVVHIAFTNATPLVLRHFLQVEPEIRYLLSNLPDWDIPNGHYYTQTGANQGGYRVTNEGGVAFWNEYQRLGGVELLGFPVSSRYFFEDTFMQAFQKAILKWDADDGKAKFYPVLEQISFLVGDSWLSKKSVPTVVVFFETEDEALTLLDYYPSVKTKFFANPFGEEQYPYWREHYGYPSGSDEYNAFIALRTSNAVFQLWKIDHPGVAKAGEVTLMNVGDLAKEAGIIPKEASIPGPPN